jgi:hypothetical protein
MMVVLLDGLDFSIQFIFERKKCYVDSKRA